jgi:hypothetical protein
VEGGASDAGGFARICARAQDLGSAVLSGNVIDPSGAAISGAELMVTSKAMGIGRTATTNAAGLFTVNALSPGGYDVKISAKGFQPNPHTI